MELVGATRVMRVEQHQFHVPFVQRFHLLGPAEADQVLLKAPPGFVADALFLHRHRHPIVLPQPVHDPGGGHERVPWADAHHRPRGKDARGLSAEGVLGQGRGLEVGGVMQVHTLFSFQCRPPGLSRLALCLNYSPARRQAAP